MIDSGQSVMWIYETPVGIYKEDSLYKLLKTILKHRLHHLKKDGKWMD